MVAVLIPPIEGNLLWAQIRLSCGDRVEGEINTEGEQDLYQFEGNQGQAIQVVGESIDPGLQLEIRVLDPFGRLIGSKSIASPRSDSIGLPEAGEYTLEVRDFLGEETGRYALSLQFTTGQCATRIECGSSPEGPVSKRAEQVAFSFEGDAGEALRITAGLESSLSRFPVVQVFGPSGEREGWSPSGDSGSIVLQEDGLHTLILSGFFSYFDEPHPDTYGVSLQFATGRCAAEPGDGGVIEREVTALVQQDAVGFPAGASSWVHLTSEALDYGPWAPQITLFDQLGTQVGSENGPRADFFIPRDGPFTAIVSTRGVQGRSYRARLSVPSSKQVAVTEDLYSSPVLAAAAAFNSRTDEYLTVYAIDVSGFGEYEIYGRRLDGESLQPIGHEFRISHMGPELDPRFQAGSPDVTYDAAGDRYLVVWSGEKAVDGKFEVYGRFLSGNTATLLGQDDLRITYTGPDQSTAFGAFRPRIGSLSSSGRSFLVWYADTAHDGAFDVFGQRLSTLGLPVGSPVRLNGVVATSPGSSSRNPDLAYNPDRGEVLVVWQGPGSGATGSKTMAVFVNGATGVSLPGGPFTISAMADENPPTSSDAPPAVGFVQSDDAYLVAWTSADGRILARLVSAGTGALLGFGSIPINSGSGGGFPVVSGSHVGNEALVVWQQDKGDGEMEIYGQKIDTALGLRSGELELQLSRVGPDSDNRFAARLPCLAQNGSDHRYLLMWAGNARPIGGNHLAGTSVPLHDTKTEGDLNWVMSARETALGVHGPLFSGSVSSAGDEGLAVVGGFGALTRMNSSGTVEWALPTAGFVSAPVGNPLTSGNGTLIVPGRPEQGQAAGHLNAVGVDGKRVWERAAAQGGWLPLAEGPDSILYAPSPTGLTALNGDGEFLWEYPTDDFTPATAPVVDPAGRLLVGARDTGTSDRSRIYSLTPAGQLSWALDIDWEVGDGYAIALGPDGTVYVGGAWLGAVGADGTLMWRVRLGDGIGASCLPVLGLRGQILCAAGNSVVALGPAGERIWAFQADEEDETFSPSLAVDGAGTVYAVSTEQGEAGPGGRLYALDGLGRLRWKKVLADESFEQTVPSFDRAGNLYLVSDQGSLFSFWTGNPVADGGWFVAGADERHSGSSAVTAPQRLDFAQFADGAGAVSSRLILLNPKRDGAIAAHVRLRDDEGRPMVVDLNDSVVNGEVTVAVPAEGMRMLQTDSLGDLQIGSASVESDESLSGLILFGGSEGLAGVGASAEQLSSFLVPIEAGPRHGLNTGVAMMNLEDSDLDVNLELRDRDGRILAESTLAGGEQLAARGHLARYVDGFGWDRPVDFSDFTGLLKVTATGRLSATAIQTRPRQFATMPVTAWSDRQWGKLLDRNLQAQASPTGPYHLRFAQFADGVEGANSLFSEILLFNPDQSSSAQATLRLRDDTGAPIRVDLNGQMIDGGLTITLPPLGLRILRTDGRGELVIGSATVESDGPVSGVIVFGGVTGLAGVGSSQELADGFIAPMETDAGQGIDTGVAVVNLEDRQTTLTLSLLDPDGVTVAHASLDGTQALSADGHRALFVDHLQWDAPVDFGHFEGSLRVRSDGAIAATVLQTRPGRLATMPVVPIAPSP